MMTLNGGEELNTRLSSAKLLLAIAILCSSAHLGAADNEQNMSSSAKNVILLIGDGMGFPQMTLARIDKAGGNVSQYASVELFMDRKERTGIVKTFSANSFVTDSAPASSAMATGSKTNNGVISQDSTAIQGKRDGENLTTILEMAEKEASPPVLSPPPGLHMQLQPLSTLMWITEIMRAR